MFDASQVQDEVRSDDAALVYPSGGAGDCVCGQRYSKRRIRGHQLKCSAWLGRSLEGIDYVRCKICGECGYSLKHHIEHKHGLKKAEYEKNHGRSVCTSTADRYKSTNNYDWINRAKEKGEDLSDWKANLSSSISEGILASESAREARRNNLSQLNKTENFKKRSSDIAKKTSSRKDILQKRTDALRNWREQNYDIFIEKCLTKMVQSYQSHPERCLYELVNNFYPERFKRGQQIRRIGKFISVKSGTRQIDILDSSNKIVIEFDGPRHFFNLSKTDQLTHIREKDAELNRVLVEEGFTVIRVSFDKFSYTHGGKFDNVCVQSLKDAIEQHEPKLTLIGDLYLEHNHINRVLRDAESI